MIPHGEVQVNARRWALAPRSRLGDWPAPHPPQEGPERVEAPKLVRCAGAGKTATVPRAGVAGGSDPAEGHSPLRSPQTDQTKGSICPLKRCRCHKRQRQEVEMFQGTCSSRGVNGTGGAGNIKKEAGNQGPKANSSAGDGSLKPHGGPCAGTQAPPCQWPRAGWGEQ